MSSIPRIAIIMPAYKAENTIQESIASLDDNDEPHDIIIVDDCSPVAVESIIESHPNIHLIRLNENKGVITATNIALEFALSRGYEFIALLDSDDYAAPDRLRRQREFLDSNPDVVMVGSWAKVVSLERVPLFFLSFPTSHAKIIQASYYNFGFLNSSLMYRSSVLQKIGLYSTDYPCAQDYEFSRRVAQYGLVANIPDYLVDYTISQQGESVRRRRQQLATRLKIQLQYRNFLSPHFYLGLLSTFVLWYMPMGFIRSLKEKLPNYRRR